MYNSNLLLKATREIVKQFANIEDMDEDKYRDECKKAIWRAFETDEITSEIIMYLSEWWWYVYPRNNMDFTLTWDEKENKIKAKTYAKRYNCITAFEFNANTPIDWILDSLDVIDENDILWFNTRQDEKIENNMA